jgi:hypothetical protein
MSPSAPYPLAFTVIHLGYAVSYIFCAVLIWWVAHGSGRSFMPRAWLDRSLGAFLVLTGIGHFLVIQHAWATGSEELSLGELITRGVGAVFGVVTVAQMFVHRRELARPPADQVELLVAKAAAATRAVQEILEELPPDSTNARLLRTAWALKARAGELPPLP